MSAVEERVSFASPARPLVVLLSGGRDSVCLLDLAVRQAAPITALHVNYGLRPSADEDEAFCRSLCERLGVPLVVHRPGPPVGNVQAWARQVRYREAARLGPVVATGHTATDQVETVLYRLAASPGRRALLGIRDRPGVIRPLLGCTREETAAHCAERGLSWREDPTNESDAFARNRVRNELLPALRAVHPAAETNLLRTLEILRDEAEVLDSLIDLDPSVQRIAALPPALRRLTVQAIAGRPPVASRADEILALGAGGGSAALDLGGGLRAVVEYGRLRFDQGPPPPPAPARLSVPGAVDFGAGRLTCERAADGALDAAALAHELEVRAWRPGDRMRVSHTRTLQDLFTDHKVPRERRGQLPVVISDGEIAWVAGVATGERFAAGAATRDRVRLTWDA
jgi:tRNA(Ile)-lysidine synthase